MQEVTDSSSVTPTSATYLSACSPSRQVADSSHLTPTLLSRCDWFKTTRIALLAVAFCFAPLNPAFAWNSAGHTIVALIAYDQLDPAVREKAVALLRAHPRFRDHFEGAMPREVSRGD